MEAPVSEEPNFEREWAALDEADTAKYEAMSTADQERNAQEQEQWLGALQEEKERALRGVRKAQLRRASPAGVCVGPSSRGCCRRCCVSRWLRQLRAHQPAL